MSSSIWRIPGRWSRACRQTCSSAGTRRGGEARNRARFTQRRSVQGRSALAARTPYEGLHVNGWPTIVMLRGKIIVEDGRLLGNAGDGAFLKREVSNAAPSPERSRRADG